MNDELRGSLLNLLQFFTRDARVIFQLAPRETSHGQSIMVGELLAALGEDLQQARKDDLTAGDPAVAEGYWSARIPHLAKRALSNPGDLSNDEIRVLASGVIVNERDLQNLRKQLEKPDYFVQENDEA